LYFVNTFISGNKVHNTVLTEPVALFAVRVKYVTKYRTLYHAGQAYYVLNDELLEAQYTPDINRNVKRLLTSFTL